MHPMLAWCSVCIEALSTFFRFLIASLLLYLQSVHLGLILFMAFAEAPAFVIMREAWGEASQRVACRFDPTPPESQQCST